MRYLDCVFEKDWVYAFDAIRPVPQHRLVGLKVKTSSGKKHRLRIDKNRAAYYSERRLGRKALGRVKIRLDPPAPKGWGLCGLDARPGATGIGGLGARWARVREARCDWSTYVASDDLAAERRRLAAAVDQRRRTSQDRENVNNVTGRVAVEQQDAMLRALDRPVAPVRATRAVTPSAPPLLPAAAVARVASDAPVMAPARVPSVTPMHRRVTRHRGPARAPLPEAEVIATRAIPGVAASGGGGRPEAPTELPRHTGRRAIPRGGLAPMMFNLLVLYTVGGGTALVRALRGPVADLLALATCRPCPSSSTRRRGRRTPRARRFVCGFFVCQCSIASTAALLRASSDGSRPKRSRSASGPTSSSMSVANRVEGRGHLRLISTQRRDAERCPSSASAGTAGTRQRPSG